MYECHEAKTTGLRLGDLRQDAEGKPIHEDQASLGETGEALARRCQISRIGKGKARPQRQMPDRPARAAKLGSDAKIEFAEGRDHMNLYEGGLDVRIANEMYAFARPGRAASPR